MWKRIHDKTKAQCTGKKKDYVQFEWGMETLARNEYSDNDKGKLQHCILERVNNWWDAGVAWNWGNIKKAQSGIKDLQKNTKWLKWLNTKL